MYVCPVGSPISATLSNLGQVRSGNEAVGGGEWGRRRVWPQFS